MLDEIQLNCPCCNLPLVFSINDSGEYFLTHGETTTPSNTEVNSALEELGIELGV